MLKKAKVLHYHNEISQSEIEIFANKIISSLVNDITKNIDESIKFCSYLPVGTILAQSLVPEEGQIICLPVLSSHISLPIKQGEYIWYFSDNFEVDISLVENRPLFKIKNYWLSRIHGSLISEDVNYSFKERDSLYTNNLLEENEEYTDYGFLPNFKSQNIIENNVKENQKSETSSLYVNGAKNYFNDKATPRFFSKSDDLSLQGSYNTLINFTRTDASDSIFGTPEGSLELIAGRLSLQDFFESEEESIVAIDKIIIDNKEDEELFSEDEFFDEIILDKEKYLKVTNSEGFEELFKCPEIYLNLTENDFNKQESNLNIDSDASKIIINESLDVDNNSCYDTRYLEETDNFPFYDNEIVTSSVPKEFLRSNVLIENKSIEESKLIAQTTTEDSIVSVPTVLIKTNNIRLIAREELKNDNETIPEGSIRLVKLSDDTLNYSHILMEKEGNIDISGRSVKVGNFKTEYIKQKGLSDFGEVVFDDVLFEANNSEFLKMHGKGEGLLIGHEPSLSEPLVLGNTLHTMLETILHNSIESFTLIARSLNNLQDQIRDIETSYASHTHNITSPAPGSPTSPSPALAPRAQMPILPIDVSTIEDSGILIKELEDINKNLVQMLSRFAKTT